jgi:uncharacterized protein with FMN-binding domain
MKKFILIAVAALFIAAVLPGAARTSFPGNAGAAADTLKVNTTDLAKDVEGFNGPTPVEISVVKGKITRIKLLPNQETPNFLQLVIDAGLLKALDGKSVEEASKVKLDAVTGATYSSKAIIENIHRGLDTLKK